MFFSWEFWKASSKPLVSRLSSHSQIIKRGVVKYVSMNAMKLLCANRVVPGLEKQLDRLSFANYRRGEAVCCLSVLP